MKRDVKFKCFVLNKYGKIENCFTEWLDGDGRKHDYYSPLVSNGVFSYEELGYVFLGEIIRKQYIGRKDLNGNEIYEDDIVKWGHLKGGEETPIRIAVVKYAPDLQFHILNYDTDFLGQNKILNFGSFIYADTEKWLEIIGNVHTNPQLIK